MRLCFSAPTDYIATSEVVTFGQDTTRFDLTIPITDEDNIVEEIEEFLVRLSLADSSSDVDVELNPADATVQIVDNDGKILVHF